MDQLSNIKILRNKITKYYTIAIYSYVTPLGIFGLYLLDSITFDLTNIFFVTVALGSLLPVGVIGLVFTIEGLRLAFLSQDYEKKDLGYANLIMGLIVTGAGLVSLGLGYVMTIN